MDMFENKCIRGIYASRYVASWLKEVSKYGPVPSFKFKDWLRQLVIDGEKLTDEEIMFIFNYATNGKLELETNAMLFIKK